MLALTVYAEWAWSICYLGKPIENRDFYPRSVIGSRIAIHAGVGPSSSTSVTQVLGRLQECASRAGWACRIGSGAELMFSRRDVELRMPLRPRLTTGAIVATALVTGATQDSDDPWADPLAGCHWRLDQVRVLPEPVPARGMPGLWRVPPDAEIEVRKQERAA